QAVRLAAGRPPRRRPARPVAQGAAGGAGDAGRRGPGALLRAALPGPEGLGRRVRGRGVRARLDGGRGAAGAGLAAVGRQARGGRLRRDTRRYHPGQGIGELIMIFVDLLVAALGIAAVLGASGARVVKQYERGLIFRFGRVLEGIRGPGLTLIVPGVDRLRKVNMQIVTMPVPSQEGITRDNVTVRVDAVVYFKVMDPVRAIVNVQDYVYAVAQVAQTSL